jgi:cation transport regulator ChaC
LIAYVFGYASLVALEDAEALPGRLHGFRRHWGAAMNNWEGGDRVKHFVDSETGERPRLRIAYLDIYEQADSAVNGVALPVDATRLDALDAREVNYARVDVSEACEPALSGRVFTYVGLDGARERCRQGAADGNVVVSRDYHSSVRRAFANIAPGALAEFDRTTDRLPFPERNLQVVPPSGAQGSSVIGS